jgi:hypothetical protein
MPPKGKQKPIFDDVLQKPPASQPAPPPEAPAPAQALPVRMPGGKKRSILSDSLNAQGIGRNQISPIIQNRSSEARLPEEAESNGIRLASTLARKKDTRKREPIVNFRCIPKKVKSELDQLAIRYDLPMGVLVTFIFESGLQDLAAGKLVLKPELTRAGRSLYADKEARVGRPLGGGAKGGKKAEDKDTIQTAFRGVSTTLRDRIRAVAEGKGMKVPVGEVARALLEHGIKHIKNGHWPIEM